ncbi:MAG: TonB-dependent receptor plug domain-containing protein [Gemmatimonas sp.]|nr:TonB-dependent receptor plug domain-containing protein [Gemmatimonas sp.]
MTVGVLLLALMQSSDSVRVCVRDGRSGEPLVGATVRVANEPMRVARSACLALPRAPGAPITITRVGYLPQVVALPSNANVFVSLTPMSQRRGTYSLGFTTLATQNVVAARSAASAGQVQVAISAEEARERNASGMAGVIALLPFTTLRSARGETGLSLRGARREQVVITLDGLPLNDPATGLADVSDVPLVAVQSATVQPGADPLGAGNGATGGVLALTSASHRLTSVRSGAFGQWVGEAAWAGTTRAVRWNTAASYRVAENRFAFVNDAGAQPVIETRINNDERRAVVTVGLVARRTQWNVMASTGERGMVGAANVRAFDSDRSRNTRVLLRGQTALGTTMLTTGARLFRLHYVDPTRPALDSRASAWAGDVEWRGTAWRGAWRTGVGADGLTGTGNVVQRRSRGFAAWNWQRESTGAQRFTADVGVRTDVVERSGVLPTASAGSALRLLGDGRRASFSLLARAAQAVRVPTLYDLYFSSPQRLAVRALAPERVTLDASAGVQGKWQLSRARVSGDLQLVSRDTRDAIVWFPGNFGWSPANVGRERLRGSEARAEVVWPTLTLSAWQSWYRTTLRTGGLTIPTPYVPTHSIGSQGAWRIGPHTLGANVRYQSRRPFTAGPRNALFELPAVTLLDLSVARRQRFTHLELLLTAGLDNATDTRWQSVRGFPMPGRGWSASLTLQPRS